MDLYVARPIDQAHYPPASRPAWIELADLVPAFLRGRKPGMTAFLPAQAFIVSAGSAASPGLERINRAALGVCDALLAFVPRGVGTIGVPREIEAAHARGIPVAVLTDTEGSSFSLADTHCWALDLPGLTSAVDWLERVVRENEDRLAPLPFLGELPAKTHVGDAGFDLFIAADTVVAPHAFTDVPVGSRVALPPGVWARITGRSSTLRKRGMMVAEGIIDTGYRGELFSGVWNLTGSEILLRAGERIAQLILHENVSARYRPTAVSQERFNDLAAEDDRGETGFGSTGV